ncbi:hypothetical protein [Agrobacterium cavarae]|uniref:hypothetical protein n=1 Tax=Agrobacterium cavarae TaxID=2528239 RepID=UPI003D07B395
MAIFTATDYSLTIGGTDFSAVLVSAELTIEAEDVETTAMGDTYRTRVGGLKQASVTLELHQDFASSATDDTVFTALGTSVAIVLKPTSAAVGAGNPTYSFNALVTQTQPFNSSVGDLATMSITWPVDGAVTKATS